MIGRGTAHDKTIRLGVAISEPNKVSVFSVNGCRPCRRCARKIHLTCIPCFIDATQPRQVQMMSKHRDPKTVMRYDHGRENLDQNAVNFLAYDEE